MKPTSIAIISDMHIGDKACTNELQTVPSVGHPQFLKQFADFVSTQKIRPDYLLLPGDLGESAAPAQLDSAASLVHSIAKLLDVHEERIFCTPGNHDVDWHVLEGAPPFHSLRMNQRYDSIRNNSNVFSNFFLRAKGDLFNPPHYAIWESSEIFCAGYNSSWDDGPKKSHTGKVNLADLTVMRSEFERLKVDANSKLKIFLVHHHIFQHAQLFQEDTSIAQNAEALLTLLNEFKFDLLVHGHRHIPKFLVVRLNELHPLAVLGAGTFSRAIESNYTGLAANQFHIVDIAGRNPDGAIFGKVRSWAYLQATGWMPSMQEPGADPVMRRGHGIPHLKPFGGYTNEGELVKFLRPKIEKSLRGTKKIIELSELIKNDLRFDHTTGELLDAALKTLGEEIGFTPLTPSTVPNTIMLRKD